MPELPKPKAKADGLDITTTTSSSSLTRIMRALVVCLFLLGLAQAVPVEGPGPLNELDLPVPDPYQPEKAPNIPIELGSRSKFLKHLFTTTQTLDSTIFQDVTTFIMEQSCLVCLDPNCLLSATQLKDTTIWSTKRSRHNKMDIQHAKFARNKCTCRQLAFFFFPS